VGLSESLQALSAVKRVWLATATLVYLSSFPIRALRWRQILRGQKALSLKEIMIPGLVGHMANNVLLARAGEIYRARFLGRRVQMSRSDAVGCTVVERTFDGLMLVVTTLFVFVLFPQTCFLGGAALATGLVSLTLAPAILFCGFAGDRARLVIAKGLRIRPKHSVDSLAAGSRFPGGASEASRRLEAAWKRARIQYSFG
jgi:uncharacterized protein (TIRG00374 family)